MKRTQERRKAGVLTEGTKDNAQHTERKTALCGTDF